MEPVPESTARTERLISRVLRVGVYTSLALIAAGTLLSFAGGGYGRQPSDLARLTGPGGAFPRTLDWFGHGLLHLDGQAVIVAGLLILILTPIVRVMVSLAGFARERDRTYVLITAAVLALLILSFALGKAG
jgi:uncharacterized membrane protein